MKSNSKEQTIPKFYVGMCADIIHPAYLNSINEARKYGTVTVGLLTDRAIASYKRIPYLSDDQRKTSIENILGANVVIYTNHWL